MYLLRQFKINFTVNFKFLIKNKKTSNKYLFLKESMSRMNQLVRQYGSFH